MQTAVSHTLRTLALQDAADVPVHALSGGNRRRLSVAAAMIGAPRVRTRGMIGNDRTPFSTLSVSSRLCLLSFVLYEELAKFL